MAFDTGIIARAIRTQRAECVFDVQNDPITTPTCRDPRRNCHPLIAHAKWSHPQPGNAVPLLFTPDVFEFAQLICSRISAANRERAPLRDASGAACRTARPLHPGQRPGTVENYMIAWQRTIYAAAVDCRQLHRTAQRRPLAHYNEMDEMYVNAIRTSVVRMSR